MTAKLAQAAASRAQTAGANAPKLAANPATRPAGGAYFGLASIRRRRRRTQGGGGGRSLCRPGENLRGISLIKASQFGPAKATFASVGEGGMKDIADLWKLYASTKG